MERIRYFPKGVQQLYQDCLRYKNIHDASRTPRNAWTIRPDLWTTKRQKEQTSKRKFKEPASNNTAEQLSRNTLKLLRRTPAGEYLFHNKIRPGHIPRRQHEQQRALRKDVGKMLPLVILWIPPMVGYIPLALALTIPRQVLSRQFLNDYEIQTYSATECEQRVKHCATLAKLFWDIYSAASGNLYEDVTFQQQLVKKGQNADAAGPIIDPLPFYTVFCDDLKDIQESTTTRTPLDSQNHHLGGTLSSVDIIPREYLIPLALACGVHSHLPDRLSHTITKRSPMWYLQWQVRQRAQIVAQDDALLLFEGYDSLEQCQYLTALEVQDACLMRGLPIPSAYNPDLSLDDMRLCLVHHLQMMKSVKDRLEESTTIVDQESFGLFTLHVSILRADMRDHPVV